MRRSFPYWLLFFLLYADSPMAWGQNLTVLRRPVNGAISPAMGQGLDFVHSAEPLGKGRFRLRMMNRSNSIVLPELGNGNIYTGNYGFAYGLGDAMELSFAVPFLMDSAGGFNKYGTGDPVLAIKMSRPGKLPNGFYTGYQLLIGLPLGYKGEHALDKVGGVRSFSSESLDLGLQMLADIHFSSVSLYVNGGLFRSGNIDVLTQLVYGLGMEFGRRNRLVSFNAEYQSQVAFAEQARATALLKFGLRINLFRGVELEINRQSGFLDYPVDPSITFGLRTHGFLSGRRRLESRHAIYQPPPPQHRLYAPAEVLRLAILDFEGFEEFGAGQRLVEKIKTRLEPHDSLEVVDLKRYAGLPSAGFIKPREALELAQKLGIDIVVTGVVSKYDVDRFAGLQVPYIIKLPEAHVQVDLRYRVLEFDTSKTQMQAFSQETSGSSRLRKGIRLLPVDRRDITASASAGELQTVQEAALDNLVDNVLAAMAMQFSWVPPDFLP
ncbi:MAG: hypothetical protein ACI8PG_005245 [Planctomycetota bacterium]